jgi:hypothetical protein
MKPERVFEDFTRLFAASRMLGAIPADIVARCARCARCGKDSSRLDDGMAWGLTNDGLIRGYALCQKHRKLADAAIDKLAHEVEPSLVMEVEAITVDTLNEMIETRQRHALDTLKAKGFKAIAYRPYWAQVERLNLHRAEVGLGTAGILFVDPADGKHRHFFSPWNWLPEDEVDFWKQGPNADEAVETFLPVARGEASMRVDYLGDMPMISIEPTAA